MRSSPIVFIVLSLGLALLPAFPCNLRAQASTTPYPILFVTQVPVPADFTTIGSTFGNHRATMGAVFRGGDLMIRYPNGALRNLTAEAGFGQVGHQGAQAIAVRDPCVHFSGNKAVFSMVVGAPTQQYAVQSFYWQLYEVTGLGVGQTAVITRVPYQPEACNNVAPIYASDDRIIFASDRSRTGEAHLKQLDEYETAPTVSGLFSLNPYAGDLFMMTHSPSGDFTPLLDSFGRVVFTRWDHLQRDQQADADALGGGSYGTFNYSSEAVNATPLSDRTEVFPEPRPYRADLLQGTNLRGHRFNHFFPWMMHQDGTELETLNHIGRHELHNYFDKSINGDSNVVEFIAASSGRWNSKSIENMLHIAERPDAAGTYVAVNPPEFSTHSGGQLVQMTLPPGANPDQMQAVWITHPETAGYSNNATSNHSGLYRDPLPLSDGRLVAVHTSQTVADSNLGTNAAPISRYDFRLKLLDTSGLYAVAGAPLTAGIQKTLTWWSPDILVTYSGPLWELNPVEVRARPRPPAPFTPLPQQELMAFVQAGVDVQAFRAWLHRHGLAVIVSRNVTLRDSHDRQQPSNLRIAGTATQSAAGPGMMYDVSHMQIFQGDLLRGIGGQNSPKPGRRVLAQPLHETTVVNPPALGAPAGSVTLGADGSMAAIVPARRALSWQLVAPSGEPVVRERYWLDFQPGEIRSCTTCHGLNTASQIAGGVPTNVPQALVQLLDHWETLPDLVTSLSSAATGNVGLHAGGPYDVLTVAGSAGGPARIVNTTVGSPFLIQMSTPPHLVGPTNFALFGMVGLPSAAFATQSALGAHLFPPEFARPDLPGLFTLTNGLMSDPNALLPAGSTPWGIAAVLPIPIHLTFQGLLLDPGVQPHSLSITNGVGLRVQ